MGKRSWYVSVLVLFSILLLAPAATGMQSAFADGNGSPEECKTDLNLDSDDSGQSGDEISTILTGEIVTGVCIKSGNASFTGDENADEPGVNCEGKKCKGQHSVEFTEDGLYGNNGCYEVTGLGTIEVTISKTRDDNTCKDLSHVDVISEPGECLTDNQCSDNDVCTGAETCEPQTLSCQAGTPLTCDDGNVCTGAETCDATNGCQAGTPLTCDDNETCDPTNGCQPIPPTEICEELKTINFEGLCSSTINTAISIDGNDVTLQVGVDLGTAENGYAVTVGEAREAFQVGAPDSGTTIKGQPDDTPYESSGNPYVDAGSCFFSDDVNGFDNGFNYYLSFTNPLDSLSLDLYDYSDDGNLSGHTDCSGNNACDGDFATLTVYSDLAQTIAVGTDTWIVDEDNWTDGQATTLSVDDPTGPIVSASLTFNHRDRGTGIDNITFCEEPTLPPVEICDDIQVIDFESVDCSLNVIDPISIGGTSVLLQVGNLDGYTSIPGWHSKSPNPGIDVDPVPLGPGQTANVGSPAEAFRSNGIDDQPEPDNDPNNQCFFSDTTTFTGTDPNRGGSNSFYYLTFDDPITSLSLDLFDYADDTVYGGAFLDCNDGTDYCNSGAVATLTAFENDDFTGDESSATYVVNVDEPYVDGQIANLSIPTTLGVTFLSATLTLSAPDIGTGIDNITFCGDGVPPVSPADLCENVVCDNGLFCDGVETCELGVCQPGTSPVTDDSVSCTVDSCDEGTDSIVNNPDHSVCDDGQVCNGAEICDVNLGCKVPLVCQPEPVECIDCSKPTEFTVSYDGPDGLTFDIVKLDKDGTVKEIKFDGGIVNNGESITIDSTDFNKPKETVEANSAYLFSNGDLVEIHTSCSKPLYEGLEVTSGDITLTVESGLVTHVKGAEKGTFDELDIPIDAIPPTIACYDDWKANK